MTSSSLSDLKKIMLQLRKMGKHCKEVLGLGQVTFGVMVTHLGKYEL